VSALLVGVLCLFVAQRFALIAASLLPPRAREEQGEIPSVTVVVAACNEQASLSELLGRLDRLDYPREKLSFVLVSDGSTDRTAALMSSWCEGRERSSCVDLPRQAGKAAALQLAWERGADTDLIAVYDADAAPRSDCLRILAREFAVGRLGAASGSCRPRGRPSGMVARYASLELWVYQLVNLSGRDRLGLDPPVVGANAVYRTAALREIGGFPPEAVSEDIEVSLALTNLGWRTRFLQGAVVETHICETLAGFWAQRLRWTRGLHQARRHARSLQSLSVLTGYLDRLVFLAAILAAWLGWISWLWPALYVSGPVLAIWVALGRVGQPHKAAFLLGSLPMFPVDLVATAASTLASLGRMRPQWVPRRKR
jgi:cellulose synthase/poly-beta-1,6-N-acetylglucosamine synthase-like glycosyltransferase